MLKPTIERLSVISKETGSNQKCKNNIKVFDSDKTRWYVAIVVNNDEIGDVVISNRLKPKEVVGRIENNLVAYTIIDSYQQASTGLHHQVSSSLNQNVLSAGFVVNESGFKKMQAIIDLQKNQ